MVSFHPSHTDSVFASPESIAIWLVQSCQLITFLFGAFVLLKYPTSLYHRFRRHRARVRFIQEVKAQRTAGAHRSANDVEKGQAITPEGRCALLEEEVKHLRQASSKIQREVQKELDHEREDLQKRFRQEREDTQKKFRQERQELQDKFQYETRMMQEATRRELRVVFV